MIRERYMTTISKGDTAFLLRSFGEGGIIYHVAIE